MLNPGDQAPSLELNQIGSGQIQIQPDGKPVILAFFATDCDASRMAIPHLNRFADYISSKGGRILAISQDNKKQTLTFLENAPCTFPILTDRGLKASLDYDPERVPAFYLLDGYFKVVRRQIAFNKAGLNSIAREMCDMLGAGYEPIGLEHDGMPDFKDGTPARQRDIETIVEEESRYGGDKPPATEPQVVATEPSREAEAVRFDFDSPSPTTSPAIPEPVIEEVAPSELEAESEVIVATLDPLADPNEAPISLPDEPEIQAEAVHSENGFHAEASEVESEPEPKLATEPNAEPEVISAPETAGASSEDSGEEEEIEIGDGLPMIEPTPDQIETFIAAAHRSREEVLGSFCNGDMPVTVEFAAQFASRAGCVPEDMRAFSALVSAAADPIFDLRKFRQSILSLEPLVIVNGSLRSELQLSSGAAALAGASARSLNLGRAFGLLIRTVAAASRIKESRTLGHPGRISFLLAENEEASPWESLANELGASANAVTIIAAEAPVTFWESSPGDGMTVLETLARLLGSLWNPRLCGIGDAVVALCPAHARALSLAGLNKAAVRRHLFDHAVVSARDAEDAAESGAPDPETEPIILRGQQAWRKFRALDSIRIIVAGDESSETSSVFPALISPRSGGGIVCANVA